MEQCLSLLWLELACTKPDKDTVARRPLSAHESRGTGTEEGWEKLFVSLLTRDCLESHQICMTLLNAVKSSGCAYPFPTTEFNHETNSWSKWGCSSSAAHSHFVFRWADGFSFHWSKDQHGQPPPPLHRAGCGRVFPSHGAERLWCGGLFKL